MADINKAIKPVESVRIAPLNDGSVYSANKEIKFRLGAGLDMWLVNKSYLQFNIHCNARTINALAAAPADDAAANAIKDNFQPTYIRNALDIFRTIEVYYGGDCIYTTKTHNIHQATIKQLQWGDDYLDANWSTYTTSNMILRDKTAYLKLANATSVAKNAAGTAYTTNLTRAAQDIINVQIPINQLLPIFMDVDSSGFPMRSLNQQIEIRLYVADEYLYLVDWDGNDFVTNVTAPARIDSGAGAAWNANGSLRDRFQSGDIELQNVYIYANYYTPDANEAAIIDDKCANGSYKLKYNVWEFDERQVNEISANSANIPMSVVTSNTKSILVYCFKKQTSPSVMYKPNINNFQLKFTPHVAPLQPIAGYTFSTPHEYKFQVDDVLNNIDTYFCSTNTDYNRCYQYESEKNAAGTAYITGTDLTKPSSSFVMFAMNYVSDPTDLGADSSDWNSQYQINFNSPVLDNAGGAGIQFVTAVNVECGLIIKNNKIFTFTL